MSYSLHGTPEDLGRIEKGTSILFQELHICLKEVPLQIEVRFQNTDTLSITKEGNTIHISFRRLPIIFVG